jgi:cytochrome b561
MKPIRARAMGFHRRPGAPGRGAELKIGLKMKQIARYHPLLVALHWLLAVLIIAELSLGFFGLAATPSSEPGKIGILRVHMMGGVLILALMVLRFIVRMRTSRPPAATTGYPLLDRIAPITHYGFYVLVLMMVGSGFATAITAGLGEIVFGSAGAPLPPTLMTYPPFVAHVFFAMLLAGFVVLHVLAAFYHQFVRRDGLFRRMSFERRLSAPSALVE